MYKNTFFSFVVIIIFSISIHAQSKATNSTSSTDATYDFEINPLKVTDNLYDQNIDTIPARIEYYKTGRNTYSYLRPVDLNTYVYLSFHPLTAFLFAATLDEEKISNMTVSDLKHLCFANYVFGQSDESYVYALYYIKGFEEYAHEIEKEDEFGIQSKKDVYISKLQECYANYKNEFENRYLKTCMSIIGGTEQTIERKSIKWYGKNASESVITPTFISLNKSNYNFDTQEFQIDLPFFGNDYGTNWDFDIEKRDIYQSHRGSERVTVPASVDLCKSILDKHCVGLYKFTVRPTKNIRSMSYGGMYFINSVEFIALDIIICNGYQSMSRDEIWPKIFQELSRSTIFATFFHNE